MSDDAPARASPARTRWVNAGLVVLLVVCVLVGLTLGAARVSLETVTRLMLEPLGVDASAIPGSARAVIFDIRAPRVALAALVGAALSMAGAAAQGLFRNPLAEPGLVGVSAGGSLGAAVAIVLGGPLFALAPAWVRPMLLPFAAFLGSLLTAEVVIRLGSVDGKPSPLVMLLAGIAINAFVGSLIGLAAYWASDRELRDLVFWMLGSFSSATIKTLAFAGPLIVIALLALPRFGKSLNLLSLGDLEARRLGARVARDKRLVVIFISLGVGASVSATGLIGFVGLVVPHIVRLVLGPDHRRLLTTSALLGASLLVLCDTVARTMIAPLELPIGVLTALLGGPCFLWLLARAKRSLR